jgi:hypothetical protein
VIHACRFFVVQSGHEFVTVNYQLHFCQVLVQETCIRRCEWLLCILGVCCPEEHMTDTCCLLFVQKDTWLWYSCVNTVHGGCLLPRRTRDCDTVCLLLVVQKNAWLWYSYAITVHGGCFLARRTRDCDTIVSVACCPEGHVVVIILSNLCACWLLVTQKNTWLLHVCLLLVVQKTRGCFDTAGGQPL